MLTIKRILVFIIIDIIVAGGMAISLATYDLLFNGKPLIHTVTSTFPALLIIAPVYLLVDFLWEQYKQKQNR